MRSTTGVLRAHMEFLAALKTPLRDPATRERLYADSQLRFANRLALKAQELPPKVSSAILRLGTKQASKEIGKLVAPRILEIAIRAIAVGDLELVSECLAELCRRKRKRHRIALERAIQEAGIAPVAWLPRAQGVAREFARESRGHHHLYFVLLAGYGRDGRQYGIYVGESARRPEVRFAQHKAGIRASGVVRRRGRQLLTTIGAHLSPLGRLEAKRLEREIALALRKAGIRTEGGH